MTLRRQMGAALVLQGGGSAAVLLSALWIGSTLGPEQQGQFNQIKSALEFAAALACVGMPQALYVFAQSGRLAPRRAVRTAMVVALLGLPAGGLASLVWLDAADLRLAALMMVAAALACLHLCWRALTLMRESTWRFNLVTVVPQFGLLLLAAATVAANGVEPRFTAAGMLLLWLAACWQTHSVLAFDRTNAGGDTGPGHAAWGDVARHGLATWLAASLATGAVLMVQQAATTVAGAAGLGRLTLALMLVQVLLTPVNYALPLLLRQRLRADGGSLLPAAPLLAVPMLALALIALAVGGWRSDLGMGAGYEGLHRLVAWLALAGAADAVLKLVSVDDHVEGRPGRTAGSELARAVVLAAGLVFLSRHAASLDDVAKLWLLASLASLVARWRPAGSGRD